MTALVTGASYEEVMRNEAANDNKHDHAGTSTATLTPLTVPSMCFHDGSLRCVQLISACLRDEKCSCVCMCLSLVSSSSRIDLHECLPLLTLLNSPSCPCPRPRPSPCPFASLWVTSSAESAPVGPRAGGGRLRLVQHGASAGDPREVRRACLPHRLAHAHPSGQLDRTSLGTQRRGRRREGLVAQGSHDDWRDVRREHSRQVQSLRLSMTIACGVSEWDVFRWCAVHGVLLVERLYRCGYVAVDVLFTCSACVCMRCVYEYLHFTLCLSCYPYIRLLSVVTNTSVVTNASDVHCNHRSISPNHVFVMAQVCRGGARTTLPAAQAPLIAPCRPLIAK